jgi:hypothetical protein
MVSVLARTVVERGIESLSGQTKDVQNCLLSLLIR